MNKQLAYEGMRTPWGKAQSVTQVVPGMMFVGTPGHGGIKLSVKLNKLVPDYMRAKGGWYEEDCDWSIPYVVLGSLTRLLDNPKFNDDMELAMKTFRNWKPAMYERYFETTLKPGESYLNDERLWKEENADKIQSLAAFGSGQSVRISPPAYGEGKLVEHVVAPGTVVVVAAKGGRSNVAPYSAANPEAYYIIPEEEYAQRNRFGFVVDPDRHQKVAA